MSHPLSTVNIPWEEPSTGNREGPRGSLRTLKYTEKILFWVMIDGRWPSILVRDTGSPLGPRCRRAGSGPQLGHVSSLAPVVTRPGHSSLSSAAGRTSCVQGAPLWVLSPGRGCEHGPSHRLLLPLLTPELIQSPPALLLHTGDAIFNPPAPHRQAAAKAIQDLILFQHKGF